jgi:hypothetical protein
VLPALAGIGLPLPEHASTDDSFDAMARIVLTSTAKTQVKTHQDNVAFSGRANDSQTQCASLRRLMLALLTESG